MRTDASRIELYGRISVVVIAIWALGFITALRLPYLYTDLAFKIRAYVVFPVLICVYCYFAFIYKSSKAGGKTGFRWVMDQITSGRERAKRILITIVGVPTLAAMLSWSFIEFPIWAAEITASTPFAQAYSVTEIRQQGGSLWRAVYMLTLIPENGESVDLQLDSWRYHQHPWKVGDVICVRGRTSMFGTIMETTQRGVCS